VYHRSATVTSVNDLVVWRDRSSGILEIVDPKNRWVVNVWDALDEEEKENFDFKFGGKLLVTYCSYAAADKERIRIWKVRNSPVLLHDRTCKFRGLQLERVDERFVVLRNSKSLYFISAETFEEFRTLSLRYDDWHYDLGLLFQSHDKGHYNIIRILDVATGTFFPDIRKRLHHWLPFRLVNRWASSNSRFMVIGWHYPFISHFSFYDVKAMNKTSSNRRCYSSERVYPLYTLMFRFSAAHDFEKGSFVMDESRITFNGYDGNG
jgi:hypothetical protein